MATKPRRKRKGDADNWRPLSDDQIRELSLTLCEDDETRAGALLVLVTDMRERADMPRLTGFPPWYVIRQVAFSQLGNDVIDAQVALLRDNL